MLPPGYLETVGEELGYLYEDLITRILEDIAERIRIAGEDYGYEEMYETASYLDRKLRELGLQQEWINKQLAILLDKSEAEIEQIIAESTVQSLDRSFSLLADAGYDTSGLDFTSQILKSTNVLKGEVTNLTRTTAQLARSTLVSAYDKAYLQVASGAYSGDQAIRNVIQDLVKNGIGLVEYDSGATRTVESAVRLAVRTSVNQNALACEEDALNELQINLVETSSHLGARPDHAVWQGRVFWRLYPEGGFDNFYEATGYGTGTGLGGYNCRHSFGPYFPEIGQTFQPVDEDEEENERLYDLSQAQRGAERRARAWDRKIKILEAGGQDTSHAKQQKAKYLAEAQAIVEKSNGKLKRDYSAERGYATKESEAQKAEALLRKYAKMKK